jgi:uncharacterized integral membrane protein
MPVFLIVMMSFVSGTLVAWLFLGSRAMRGHRLYNKEHKRVMALENELEGIKAEQSPYTASSTVPIGHAR